MIQCNAARATRRRHAAAPLSAYYMGLGRIRGPTARGEEVDPQKGDEVQAVR